MRYYFLLLFLFGRSAVAQTVLNPDYTPPVATTVLTPADSLLPARGDNVSPVVNDSLDRIQADPELSNRRQRTRQVLLGPGSDHNSERWYVALEGTIRGNSSLLNSTLNGLISTQGTTKFGAGASAGVVLGERWAVELAYLYQPLHNTLILANGRSPFTLRYANNGTSVMLRGKVRVGGRSKLSNGSGFWLSGGLGVVPNTGQSLDSLAFRGIIQRRRNTADTVRIAIDTYQNKRWSGLAEIGAEYVARIGARTELIVSLRWYRAMGYSLRTDVSYTVTGTEPTVATLSSGGNGWGFGVVWRYNYGLKH